MLMFRDPAGCLFEDHQHGRPCPISEGLFFEDHIKSCCAYKQSVTFTKRKKTFGVLTMLPIELLWVLPT